MRVEKRVKELGTGWLDGNVEGTGLRVRETSDEGAMSTGRAKIRNHDYEIYDDNPLWF